MLASQRPHPTLINAHLVSAGQTPRVRAELRLALSLLRDIFCLF